MCNWDFMNKIEVRYNIVPPTSAVHLLQSLVPLFIYFSGFKEKLHQQLLELFIQEIIFN